MKRIAIVLLMMFSLPGWAQTSLEEAQDKLQTTFSNISVVGFNPSPIAGLYEVNMGTGLVYFYPEKNLLMFGEIFNSEGTSLTAESLTKMTESRFSEFDTSKALTIGAEDGIEVIEFSDPDCPYCRRYDQFISSQDIKIKRHIFFDTRIHPKAAKKVEHILCSKDKEQAYKNVFSNKVITEYKRCADGREAIKEHLKVSKGVGVSGTPTFLLDGKLVTGFQQGVIANYLKKEQQKLAAK